MKTKYTLGLDLGISSCGFGLIDFESNRIIASGVRCFTAAEHPKTGASLAKPRREKRALRRVIKRRRSRLRQIWGLGVKFGLVVRGSRESVINGIGAWDARVAGLDRLLTGPEFMRALLHIAKRRGFRSSKRVSATTASDDNGGKLLEGTRELEKAAQGARTVGEYLYGLDKKRNSDGLYSRTVLRALLEKEVDLLFSIQETLGSKFSQKELKEAYKNLAFSQRALQSTVGMIGKCQFEPSELRAPRCAYSAERARVLQELNHLRLIDSQGSETMLTSEQHKAALELAYSQSRVKYSSLRKLLGIGEDCKFIGLIYSRGQKSDAKNPEDKTFVELKGFHTVKKALKKLPESFSRLLADPALFDALVWHLTVIKDENELNLALLKEGFAQVEIDCLLPISFVGHSALSVKALRRIIPYLEEGLTYDKAVEKAGYTFTSQPGPGKYHLLPPLNAEVTNPVVKRAISQARKVVNAIINRYGMPHDIHIELARELSRSFNERRDISAEQEKRREYRTKKVEHFEELFGRTPRTGEFDRFLLWQEQGQFCPYCHERIEISEVLSEATQVDHILPFSRSFDDSFSNRVLVHAKENQEKRERTPYEYFGASEEKWEVFCSVVRSYPEPKRRRLLLKSFSEVEDNWKDRHLNDTRYISRLFYNYIRQNLALPDDSKQHVFVRNGRVTASLRYFWGLKKDREAGDKHHALDALVVASSTNGQVNALTHWAQARERGAHWGKKTEERLFPLPWESFREDVAASVSQVFVSRQPNRKIRGEAHEATVRSERIDKDGKRVIVERTPVSKLTSQKLELLWDKERNVGLYLVLKRRLEEYANDEKNAFTTPLYMPCKRPDGRGPEIKSVILRTNERSGRFVGGASTKRRGIASNGSMVRIDIFKRGEGYYACPLYVPDFVAPNFPMKLVSGRTEEDWLPIDDNCKFLFSLYQNDYIQVVKPTGELFEGYYNGFDRNSGRIVLLTHDRSGISERISIRGLKSFEKYAVDLLGTRSIVRGEVRGLASIGSRKSRIPSEQG